MTKIIPVILFLPLLLNTKEWHKQTSYLLIFGLICLLSFIWFFPHTPLSSLTLFVSHIEGDGVFFNAFSSLFSPITARILTTIMGGLVLAQLLFFSNRYSNAYVGNNGRGKNEYLFITIELLIIAFVFSTMGFPWYLLSTIPILTIFPKPYFMGFIATTQLTYYLDSESIKVILMSLSALLIIASVIIQNEFFLRRSIRHVQP